MNELPPDLLDLSWDLVHDCYDFEEFMELMGQYTEVDHKEHLFNIWTEFWSKEQSCCPDCDATILG